MLYFVDGRPTCNLVNDLLLKIQEQLIPLPLLPCVAALEERNCKANVTREHLIKCAVLHVVGGHNPIIKQAAPAHLTGPTSLARQAVDVPPPEAPEIRRWGKSGQRPARLLSAFPPMRHMVPLALLLRIGRF